MKKQHLPEKKCPVCQHMFSWRKKWERDWDHVKYCSKRCQGNAKKLSFKGDGDSHPLAHSSNISTHTNESHH